MGLSNPPLSVTPGGSPGQVQVNAAGAFGGAARVLYAASGDLLLASAGAISDKPLIVQGFAGQTANLTEWRDNKAAVLASVAPDGSFVGSGASLSGVVHITGMENITGGKVFLGGLGVGDGTGQPTLNINGAIGQVRDLAFRSASVNRWLFRVDNAAEAGSNAGSNFLIEARADGGGFVGDWFQINRATGLVTIGTATISQAGVFTGSFTGSGANVTGVVHTTGTESIAGAKTFSNGTTVFGDGVSQPIVALNGGAGTLRDVAFRTAGVNRWLFRADNVAESGSDAGSNFLIEARTDAGGFAGDWFQINRATGLVTMGAATVNQAGTFSGGGFLLPFAFVGTGVPTIANDVAPWLDLPFAATAFRLSLTCKTPPTGNFTITIKRSSDNGVTFPDTIATVTVASGARIATTTAMTNAALVAGNVLRCDITAVNGAADWTARLTALSRNV